MATDDERRRAAASLRKIRSGWASGTCYYAIINALGYPDTSREDGGRALYSLLADLIEPSCDRDALLALADEMESLCGPWSDCGKHYAPLVREALGVSE